MNNNYDDIINMPHHVSAKRKHMSMIDRAAQFSPFAALTGYNDVVSETARLTSEKQDLSDDTIAYLNEQLNIVKESIADEPMVTFTYFVPDEKKSGGKYISYSGTVKSIDEYKQIVIMTDGTVIQMEQICEIDSELFDLTQSE